MFKEAVTNVIKHAACTEAGITLAIEHGVLRLEIRDNGRGFDPASPDRGPRIGQPAQPGGCSREGRSRLSPRREPAQP